MPESILDGHGSGNRAEVDEEGDLHVKALLFPHIAHHSKQPQHQNAFAIYAKHQTVTPNTDEIAVSCVYTGNAYLTLHNLVISTTATILKVEFFLDPTLISGGAVRLPVNLSRSGQKLLDATVLDTNNGASPITATLDGGLEIYDFRFDQYSDKTIVVPLDTALYFPKNKGFAIRTNSGSAGDKVRITINAFDDEVE